MDSNAPVRIEGLSRLQAERNEWVAYNFPDEDNTKKHHSPMGATEEMIGELIPLLLVWEALGRLNHHWIKAEAGIRGTPEQHKAEIRDACADAVIFLAGVATHFGFDFGAAVHEVWEEVKTRDWVKYPENGRTA